MTNEPNNDAPNQRMDEVIVAYLDVVRAGQKPNVQEWLTRHPDIADELASFFVGNRLT